MATKTKTPIPFSVMSGEGDSFIVGEKTYTVNPMLVGDALKFADDNLSVGSQIFNIAEKNSRKKIDGYLSKYCTNEKGDAMSLDAVVADEWDVVHLKNFVKKLVDISG